MGQSAEFDTDQLINLAGAGDPGAVHLLFERHRLQLRTMVARRMDPLLSPRIDPSDVVQDSFAAAFEQFPEYLARRPVRFYPWLRQIAWERLIELQRMHVKAQCRSVRREQELDAVMSHESADFLAEQLAASNTGPLQKLARKELNERVRQAIERLSPPLREALLVRYLEQLSAKDAADVLSISPATFKQRLLRALRQLREYLSSDREDLP